MRIAIDEDRCCGAGQCVMAAPDVFDQREGDGMVLLLTDDPEPSQMPGIREAAAVCPAAAITIHQDEE